MSDLSKNNTLVKANNTMIEIYSSAVLAGDSSVFTKSVDWKPKRWIAVLRFTAGYGIVYLGSSPASQNYRAQSGIFKLPFNVVALTVQTFAVNGFYDIYAIDDDGSFDVTA